eukprot:scaffold285684_cov23-Prasinocladus_malaysianus.AAC.1
MRAADVRRLNARPETTNSSEITYCSRARSIAIRPIKSVESTRKVGEQLYASSAIRCGQGGTDGPPLMGIVSKVGNAHAAAAAA